MPCWSGCFSAGIISAPIVISICYGEGCAIALFKVPVCPGSPIRKDNKNVPGGVDQHVQTI